ncbi:MAG: flagellar hook-length control protein FliK, partial [Methylococcaceae bacterium]
KEASSDIVSAVSEQDSKPVDNLDAVIAQVIPTAVIVPQVAAQATSVQPKIETATETSSDTTTPNKLTLTSASTLLKEAVANRSNTNGDTANSGNNSSGNTPQNTALPDNALAALLNDNKQSTADLKPFASLLTAEKTDITGATTTAPTTDKTTPQAVTSAVNKLVQDTKIDVPAMTKPLSHPEWNQDLGDRIVWMNNRGISSAEIRMNPQNMGPITVRIDVNQDQATIAFTAQNNEVRTALEASIPKLREMLNTQQLTLADVKVTQQSSTNADSGRSQQQATQTADASTSGQSNRQNNPEVDAQGNPRPVNANGDEIIVDEFANAQVLNMNGTNGLLSVHA